MKTIAMVTDAAFWENTYGSHTRMQGLARFLASQHKLIVFYLKPIESETKAKFVDLGLPDAQIVSYKSYLGKKSTIRKRVSEFDFYRGVATDDFCASLRAFIDENQVHAVIFEYIRLAYMVDACPTGLATIIDSHDIMSERMISLTSVGLKASVEIDAASERQIMASVDRVLTISRRDDDHLRNVFGLTNGLYAPPTFKRVHKHEVSRNGRRLIFIGADTAPNVLGLRWFLDSVWPLMQPEGFILDVVGTIGRSLGDGMAGVNVHGQLDDVSELYSVVDVAINPVFIGGGLKIKCIEALAFGLPCVTTREGAAGLAGAVGNGLTVAESRLAFFSALRHFAESPADRRIAAFLGPRFIEREFSDSVAFRRLGAYLNTLNWEARSTGSGCYTNRDRS